MRKFDFSACQALTSSKQFSRRWHEIQSCNEVIGSSQASTNAPTGHACWIPFGHFVLLEGILRRPSLYSGLCQLPVEQLVNIPHSVVSYIRSISQKMTLSYDNINVYSRQNEAEAKLNLYRVSGKSQYVIHNNSCF